MACCVNRVEMLRRRKALSHYVPGTVPAVEEDFRSVGFFRGRPVPQRIRRHVKSYCPGTGQETEKARLT
jgi:hypothetical protein